MTAETPAAPASSTKKKSVAALVAAAIITSVVTVEGGYVNNPKDPGGPTKDGITEVVARQHNYTGDMKNLPRQTAIDIYRQDYITKPGFEPFLELSPAVAHELTDTGVNAGTGRAARWLQVSLNALNRSGKDYADVKVDGSVGPGTINAYKALAAKRGSAKACQLVIKLLDVQQGQHYLNLTNLETFTPGWVDNRIENVPLSDCR